MSLTLTRRVKSILQNGINTVREHRSEIIERWTELLLNLKKNQAVRELEAAIGFFADWLFSEEKELETLFGELPRRWEQLPIQFRPNHVIFIMALIENAAHEVIKPEFKDSYRKHQAIQYLFMKISETLIPDPLTKRLDIDTFLDQLVTSKQLPIIWVARAGKEGNGFNIKKLYNKNGSLTDHNLPFALHAETLFALSEALLEHCPAKEEQGERILPIPWRDETLMICTSESDSNILPFITFALQQFHSSEKAHQYYKQEHHWKDAVILFNDWIMRSLSLKEAIENITSGFVNYLPFERCALFSYSDTDQSGLGLYGYHLNNDAIQNIRENVVNIPLIYKFIQRVQFIGDRAKNLQPIHIRDAKIGLPDKYVQQFQLESIVIAPIFAPSEGKLIGAAILDQGPGKPFKIARETYMALMKFGQSAGELLVKYERNGRQPSWTKNIPHLSPREIEVLKLMAEGASTNEAAQQLYLSEYTVRDYISSILQKMNARNRTEAVVKAIRDQII